MSYAKRIAALAGISLAACGGGTPDLTPAAVAEATATLETSKFYVTRAYMMNNHTFPTIANAPIPTTPNLRAVYVTAVSYNSTGAVAASVVLTLDHTGNVNVDGKFLGMFGTGQTDGTVNWMCGTATASTVTAPGAQLALYPYLPPECQH
jgi:type IV pilus assembly protein PilA